ETFLGAKLTWAWPEGSKHAQLRELYQDLLAARRAWPALRDRQHTVARVLKTSTSQTIEDTPALLLLERGGDNGVLIAANLSMECLPLTTLQLKDKKPLLSTEDARYGGNRTSLPSPFGRCPQGEGAEHSSFSHACSPQSEHPPKSEEILQEILPHELLIFDLGRGQR
ncbi:MAG: DUF3459 domain-containing protein, partial [Thermoguttaceae bacterium]